MQRHTDPQVMRDITHPMPRGPVLDWSSFRVVDVPGIPSIEQLAHRMFTTSGRAAIYQALRQLDLPAQSLVLVPTYHCPTMIAPVILAHLTPTYFGLRADALPDLDAIDPAVAGAAKAMLVPHYFGLAQSLAEVRAWCDQRGIALIEDCAHCFFGEAGERPAGAWGDFATASLSKFLPVPEAGLLASAHRPIKPTVLHSASLKAQIKGGIDVLEYSARYQQLAGLSVALGFLFKLKNARHSPARVDARLDDADVDAPASEETLMRDCDMARIDQRPLLASQMLKAILPRGRIIARRQRNFSLYAEHLRNLKGARPLRPLPSEPVAPYVFPLWVDDADRVYHTLRTRNYPVFRWDRIWPGTPTLPGDVGLSWSRHVVQLLCHQDLSEGDIQETIIAVRHLLDSA